MRVAVIGLGVMGLPMSINLVRAGFEVAGYTRTRTRAAPLVDAGGTLAETLSDAVAGADVVITMLPDSPDVIEVCTAAGGVFESAAEGTLLLETSTISPNAARRLHDEAAAAGIVMLDAPVSGGQAGAESATLSIMCGGSADAFARAQTVLRAVGATIVHVGGPGSGQTVKAANQLLVAGTIQLLAEALVFLDAHEVDLESAVKVLGGGLAGSAVLDRKAASMIAGEFAPGFRVDLHHKDLGIYCDAARQHGVFSPAGALVAELVAALRASGAGDLDHSALLLQEARLSGSRRWTT